jgi:patatin-like phospholipase/acyl hydrolase
MNLFIRDAAQASSAAPIYFDPKSIDGISDALIDGGVIANSPAFYSYLHVKYVSKKSNNIRLVSIGTGEQQPAKLTQDSVNKVTWVSQLGALITSVEQNTHDFLSKELLADNYYRFQIVTNVTLSLDSYQESDIKKLIDYGNQIVTNNEATIKTLVETLIDQKVADGTIAVPLNVTCP